MADPIDFGPGRTPRLGLFYGSDAATNANLDRLDKLIADLQARMPGPPADEPPPPVTEPAPAPEPTPQP